MKEIIRRIYFWLCWLGLADAEVIATTGTIKHRFYMWLYGDPEPLFDIQWPEDEAKL